MDNATYSKLGYCGNEINSNVYFAFDADYFDVDLVTNNLKVLPTSVMIKKEPIPTSTYWNYRIEAGNDIDLEYYVEKIMAIFEPKIENINQLKRKFNLDVRLQFVIEINIHPDASTPYFGLNKRTIDFLGNTNTKVDFDVYKIDTL